MPPDFEALLLPHLDAAYTVARYLLRDDDAAQDVVQESYLRALRHFGGFRGDNAKAWLLTIVRNCCATWRANERRDANTIEFDERAHSESQEDARPDVLVLRASAAEAVRRAVRDLPREFAEVIVLREIEGMSYSDIALVIGAPIGTVMSRLSRARKRLQTILGTEARDAI